MSDKNEFSASEVALKILEKTLDKLSKSEVLLAKAKNTAHEIEPGKTPEDNGAECPPSLEGNMSESSENTSEPIKQKKVKKIGESEDSSEEESEDSSEEESEEESEDYSMEKEEERKRLDKGDLYDIRGYKLDDLNAKRRKSIDNAKHWDTKVGQSQKKQFHEAINRTKEEKKKMKKEEYDKVEKCGEYEFRKSQAGMHTIEYKVLKKQEKRNPEFNREAESKGKSKEWTGAQKTWHNATKPGHIKSNRNDQAKFIEQAKQKRKEYRDQGLLKEEVKETKGIDFDQPKKADKDKEEFKRPIEKCGDIKKCGEIEPGAKKAENGSCGIMKEKGISKLKKFVKKKKE